MKKCKTLLEVIKCKEFDFITNQERKKQLLSTLTRRIILEIRAILKNKS